MKKTNLLTSVVALFLVLSLGACNEAEDNTTLDSGPKPSELVENAYLTGNYSVKIEYSYELTEETLTWYEYSNYMSYDPAYPGEDYNPFEEKYYSVLYDGTYTSQSSFTLYIYCSTDYLYFEEFIDDELCACGAVINVEWFPMSEVLVFYTLDGTEFISSVVSAGGTNVRWQDTFHNLFLAYEDGIADHFIYDDESDTYGFDDWGYYDGYYPYSHCGENDWLVDITHRELLYSGLPLTDRLSNYIDCTFSSLGLEKIYYSYSLYDEEKQEIASYYEYLGMDYWYHFNDGTMIPGMKQHLSATIYDVGKTDKEDEFNYFDYIAHEVYKYDNPY